MKLLRLPLWLAATLAGLLVAYVAFGFLIAPGLIRGALLRAASERLTQPPTLEGVRVNPLNLSIHFERFKLSRADAHPVLGFDDLYIRFDPIGSLLDRGVSLARLRLDRPWVDVELLPGGALDIAQLIKVDSTAVPDTSAQNVPLRIGRLLISGGALSFTDRTRTPSLEMGAHPVDLVLSEFRTRRGADNSADLRAATAAAESLHWHGTFTLAPFHSAGLVELKNVQAGTLTRLLGPMILFSMPRGSADFATHYSVDGRVSPIAMSLDSLRADLRDWALANRAGDSTMVDLKRARLLGGQVDVTHARVALDSLDVDGGSISAWMERNGHMNFEAWSPPPDTTVPPWVTHIRAVGARGLAVHYEDRQIGPPAVFELHPVNATLHGISTEPGARAQLRAAAGLFENGVATADGTIDLLKPATDLNLNIERFPLTSLQPYMDHFNRLLILDGLAFGKGRLRFNDIGPKGPLIRYEGALEVRGFKSVDKKLHQDLLRWNSLKLASLRYDVAPSRVDAKQVDVDGGFARVVVGPDRIPNLAVVGLPPEKPVGYNAMKVDSTDTLKAVIGLVNIRNSTAYFSDLSLTPNFSTGIEALNGSIKGLSSFQESGGEIALDGQVDRYAPVSVRGAFNPLSPGGHTDVSVSFKHIELTTFTPYSGKFMGYPITRGKLTLDLHYVVDGRQLVGENKVLMEQLTLGKKVDSPDATHLPVRFAIALLKDKNGNIDLDLPVKGSLDDPKFSVMRLVLKVLTNLVTKAVSSPFKALGALVGGGQEEDLGIIEFPPGSAVLDTAQAGKIDRLAKALTERPELRLDVPSVYDVIADSTALVRAQFHAHFQDALAADRAKQGRKAPAAGSPATAEERARVLEKMYVSQFGSAPPPVARTTKPKKGTVDSTAIAAAAARVNDMEQRLLGAMHLEPGTLNQLGHDRALAVKDKAVALGANADQIFVTEITPTRTPGDAVRVEMSLDGR